MGMLQEFKDFALRGNVVDMAVGIVIGAGFGKIVSVFVEKIVMPLVGLLGGVDFSKYDVQLKEGAGEAAPVMLGVGSFATAVLDFAIVAFAIFLAVKAINTLKKRFEEQKAAEAPATPEEIALLREIRDALKR